MPQPIDQIGDNVDPQEGNNMLPLVGLVGVVSVAGSILYVNGNLADAAAIEEVVVEIIGDHN